ncbi:hypothetical protein HMPREF0580_1292 [Mobiluncus mulieris ATCC 35239]|uniref:Uncharacterized protein n=1 Tax=Mobiluncus mulieris ATCC 35239 TaxID=871571 RepID=E0QQX7_9ACTO|nr:hypothetical protein [Mobiluncus mulieris]EFM45970.1 hypothetical protein HMPREF0580_1292 [Mobiluncus mulieris ATCC 35239]
MERFSPLTFKDKPNPSPENSAKSTPRGERRSAFGQSLPRTAPVEADTSNSRQRRQQALFNVPDWRNEDDIIIEAAQHDPTITVPERLRPRVPRVIEGRPPRESGEGLAVDLATLLGTAKAVVSSGSRGAIPETEPATTLSGLDTKDASRQDLGLAPHESDPESDAANEPQAAHKTEPKPRPTNAPVPPPLLRIMHRSDADKNTARPTVISFGEGLARMLGNLVALMVPTLCVLLLSGWGPKEVAIIFEDFWAYLGLAFGLTVILVGLDVTAQLAATRMRLAKPGEWILEFGLSSLGVGFCLFFFTFSVLGALLLALVMSVLTSLLSVLVAKIF